jgi:hypothetical protein
VVLVPLTDDSQFSLTFSPLTRSICYQPSDVLTSFLIFDLDKSTTVQAQTFLVPAVSPEDS